MKVAANMEIDVVALSYLLGVIVKDIVNSNHTSAHYQVRVFYVYEDFIRKKNFLGYFGNWK